MFLMADTKISLGIAISHRDPDLNFLQENDWRVFNICNRLNIFFLHKKNNVSQIFDAPRPFNIL
jgi:hypothetical protein